MDLDESAKLLITLVYLYGDAKTVNKLKCETHTHTHQQMQNRKNTKEIQKITLRTFRFKLCCFSYLSLVLLLLYLYCNILLNCVSFGKLTNIIGNHISDNMFSNLFVT